MANRQLITGAGKAYGAGFIDAGQALGANIRPSQGLNPGVARAMQRKMQMKQNDALVKGYINGLSTEMDLLSLSDAEQVSLKAYLFEQRKEYARLANELVQVDAMSPLYVENMNKMDSIKQSFLSLKGQTEKFKERKLQYLDDLENGRISKGNKLDDYDRASKVYGGGSLYIGTDGGINVITDGGKVMTDYSTLQDPFLKDFKTADEILDQNNKLYVAGVELDASKEGLLRNKLRSQLSQDGSLESIVEDGLINNQRLNVDLESYETREDAIEAVAEILLQGYRDSAIAGKREKDTKKRKLTGDDDQGSSDTYLGYERNSKEDRDNFESQWKATLLRAKGSPEGITLMDGETKKVLVEGSKSEERAVKWYSSADSKKYQGRVPRGGISDWILRPVKYKYADGTITEGVQWKDRDGNWQFLNDGDFFKELTGEATTTQEGGAAQFNQ